MKKVVKILNNIQDGFIELYEDECLYYNVLTNLRNKSDKLGWKYLYKSVLETWPHYTGDFDNPIPNPANAYNDPERKWHIEISTTENGTVEHLSGFYRWKLLEYFLEALNPLKWS